MAHYTKDHSGSRMRVMCSFSLNVPNPDYDICSRYMYKLQNTQSPLQTPAVNYPKTKPASQRGKYIGGLVEIFEICSSGISPRCHPRSTTLLSPPSNVISTTQCQLHHKRHPDLFVIALYGDHPGIAQRSQDELAVL
jgi:hypothetical protein